MKKLLSTLALVAIAFTTINAQNVNVTEKYYGARKGGFALSFGADPIVNFVGNMFNGTTKQEFEGFKGLGSDLFNGAFCNCFHYGKHKHNIHQIKQPEQKRNTKK